MTYILRFREPIKPDRSVETTTSHGNGEFLVLFGNVFTKFGRLPSPYSASDMKYPHIRQFSL